MKTVPASPNEPCHPMTEELRFIVRSADIRALEQWIAKYVRKVGVTMPVIQPPTLGADPVRFAQARVAGNLGMAVSRAAVWSEMTDVANARKVVHAGLYFLDVMGAMPIATEVEH